MLHSAKLFEFVKQIVRSLSCYVVVSLKHDHHAGTFKGGLSRVIDKFRKVFVGIVARHLPHVAKSPSPQTESDSRLFLQAPGSLL
jgi:hypothetical protein